MSKKKINLGCGTDVRSDCVNVDDFPLTGVNIVHDLSKLPWPFNNEEFDEALMINVLEHFSNTVSILEELWRILKIGGTATIRVPYWNCRDSYIDPTHIKYFHEESLNFYDPKKFQCKNRPYISTARFAIERITYFTKIGKKFHAINNPIIKAVFGFFATYLNNIIWTLEFEVRKIQNTDR